MTAPSTPTRSARERRRGVAVGFDFTAPVRLSREHARVLEGAFDAFARQWTLRLGTSLRVTGTVEVEQVQQESYEAYVDRLENPSPVVLFTAEGAGGTGTLQMASATVLSFLDHSLGGPGGEQPTRELTAIETTVARQLGTTALAELGEAFAAITPLAPVVTGVQQNPQLMQAARAADMVLVCVLSVRVGEVERPATIALPMAGILPRLVAASATDARTAEEVARERAAATLLDETLRDVPVDVAVRLVPLTTSPEHVLSLAVGDVVRLPHPVGRPLQVTTGDVVGAHVVPTTTGPRRTCLVVAHEEDPR